MTNWWETLQTCYSLFPGALEVHAVIQCKRAGLITADEFNYLKENCFGATYFDRHVRELSV